MNSRWRSKTTGYRSLHDLHVEKENVSWYWRLSAQIALWMILGGYLILPSTFNSDTNLRFSETVLIVVIVGLLTGGYSLTAVLCFACPSILFRLDAIFIPGFACSTFAFLATVYTFASSSQYSIFEAMGPTTLGLSATSALIYGVLALISQRQIRVIDGQTAGSDYQLGASRGMWQNGNYHKSFVQNMSPPSRGTSSLIGSTEPPVTEDDMVNKQMATLLMKMDPGLSPGASQSTFRLEWPLETEFDEGRDSLGRRQRDSVSIDSRLLAPSSLRGHDKARDESFQDRRSGAEGELERVIGAVRGRPDERAGSQARGKSRDERRQEIELGWITPNPPLRS